MTAIALPVAPDRYRFKYLIAITVSLASVLELLDTSIVNVAIPHMMGNLGATLDQIAWVSTGYIVANVIVLPITGWLSAYFGRRRYFAGSIALFTFASFMCGNAGSLGALVFWRIIQGLGGGALLSTSQAILYEEFPREEFGTAMAIFGVGVMVGPTLGPTVGGWITDMYGWPWIFYINIPFGMLALALTLSFITDSEHQQKVGGVDWLGLGLLAAGVGALQIMLERGERLDWFASGSVRLLAITSVVSLITFIWHELHTDHPVVDLRILKSRQLAVGVVFGLVLGVCLYATVFVLPVYLQNVRNFTANQTGLVILPGALASAFTMASMGRLTGKFDARLSIAAGVGVFALSMWKHAHFTTESGMSDFFWPLIFRGVGLGLIFVPLTNLALADLPMSRIPNGTGLFNLMRQLGGSVGIALSATLIQRFTAIHRADLAANITPYAEATRERLTTITNALIARGDVPAIAQTKAIGFLNGIVTKQAMMLSFDQLFLLFGAVFVLSLPLLLLMHKSRGGPGGGGRGRGRGGPLSGVRVGDLAPDFTLPDQLGEQVRLGDLVGKKNVVLYFYPKDATPGCTAEARAFRDAYDTFTAADTEVVGVSSDSVKSHRRFAAKHQLPFRLLSDPDGAVRALYGVERTLGILPGRVTYVIDRQCVVQHVYSSQFAARKHVREAREAVRCMDR